MLIPPYLHYVLDAPSKTPAPQPSPILKQLASRPAINRFNVLIYVPLIFYVIIICLRLTSKKI